MIQLQLHCSFQIILTQTIEALTFSGSSLNYRVIFLASRSRLELFLVKWIDVCTCLSISCSAVFQQSRFLSNFQPFVYRAILKLSFFLNQALSSTVCLFCFLWDLKLSSRSGALWLNNFLSSYNLSNSPVLLQLSCPSFTKLFFCDSLTNCLL